MSAKVCQNLSKSVLLMRHNPVILRRPATWARARHTRSAGSEKSFWVQSYGGGATKLVAATLGWRGWSGNAGVAAAPRSLCTPALTLGSGLFVKAVLVVVSRDCVWPKGRAQPRFLVCGHTRGVRMHSVCVCVCVRMRVFASVSTLSSVSVFVSVCVCKGVHAFSAQGRQGHASWPVGAEATKGACVAALLHCMPVHKEAPLHDARTQAHLLTHAQTMVLCRAWANECTSEPHAPRPQPNCPRHP